MSISVSRGINARSDLLANGVEASVSQRIQLQASCTHEKYVSCVGTRYAHFTPACDVAIVLPFDRDRLKVCATETWCEPQGEMIKYELEWLSFG